MHRCTPQKWKVAMHRHKSRRAKNSWREKIAGQNKSARRIAPKRWRRCLTTTLPLVRGKLTSLLLRVLNHSLTNLILYMCNKRILKHRWLWCQVINTPTGPPAAVEDKLRLRQESKSYAATPRSILAPRWRSSEFATWNAPWPTTNLSDSWEWDNFNVAPFLSSI